MIKEKIRRVEDLSAWQKARTFASDVFRVASKEPFARDYPIRDQLCSAALSISSNIAEGFERTRLREFHQFLSIAKGSCAEARSQVYMAHDIGYIPKADLDSLLARGEEVGRIVGGLRRSIESERLRTQDSGPRT